MKKERTGAHSLKLLTAIIVSLTVTMLLVTGCSGSDDKEKKEDTSKTLYGATLVGYFDKSNLLCTDINDDAKVEVYNADTGDYEAGKLDKKTILGNYLRLKDTDKDDKADLLQVIKREDSTKVWDQNVEWTDGTGEKNEPALSDDKAKASYTGAAAEQRIPFGERLLAEHGFTDYSGAVDFNNTDTDEYWCHNNWYTQKSGNGLIMLEGFKSIIQSTFWSCTAATATAVLEWYGQRGDINERDVAAMLPDLESFDEGAVQGQQEAAFKRLAELDITCDWTIESCLDGKHADSLQDPEYIKGHLAAGHPIILNWNSWGSHASIIIGYDDMNTKKIEDDVLVIADPYDSTDQLNDGYNLESYARVAKGLSDEEEDNFQGVRFMVAYPKDDSAWKGYTPSKDGKVPETYKGSPYYPVYDYAKGEGPTDTLKMIKGYETIQQDSEWSSGKANVQMLLKHFGKDSSAKAAKLNGGKDRPAFVSDIVRALKNKSVVGSDHWNIITNYDTKYDEDDEVHYLNDEFGYESNMVPYLIEHDIPIMVGWDEWGGHWQTIIGYDDMGTEETEDDVVILAESRDTTDHHLDGYMIESYERMVFGCNSQFEEKDPGFDDPVNECAFVIAFPDSADGAKEVKADLGL